MIDHYLDDARAKVGCCPDDRQLFSKAGLGISAWWHVMLQFSFWIQAATLKGRRA